MVFRNLKKIYFFKKKKKWSLLVSIQRIHSNHICTVIGNAKVFTIEGMETAEEKVSDVMWYVFDVNCLSGFYMWMLCEVAYCIVLFVMWSNVTYCIVLYCIVLYCIVVLFHWLWCIHSFIHIVFFILFICVAAVSSCSSWGCDSWFAWKQESERIPRQSTHEGIVVCFCDIYQSLFLWLKFGHFFDTCFYIGCRWVLRWRWCNVGDARFRLVF